MSHEFSSSSPAVGESERPHEVEVAPVERQEPRAYQVRNTEFLNDPSKKGKEKTYCINKGIIEWIDENGNVYVAMRNDSSVMDKLKSQGYRGASFTVDYSNGEGYNAPYILGVVYANSASNEMNRLAVERGMRDRVVGAVTLDDGNEKAVTTDLPFDRNEYNYVESFLTLEKGESEKDVHARDIYRQGVGTFTSEHGIITCVTSQGRVLSFADSDFARKRLEEMGYTGVLRLGVQFANSRTEEEMDTMQWLLESGKRQE